MPHQPSKGEKKHSKLCPRSDGYTDCCCKNPMPKPLSKIREENRSEFEKQFGYQIGNLALARPHLKSHLSISESRIIEGIKEWVREMNKDKVNVKKLGYEISDGVKALQMLGYSDALSDLLAFLDEGLTSKK